MQIIVNGPQVAVAAKNSYEIEVRQDAAAQNVAPADLGVGKKLPGVMPQQLPLNMQARVVDQKTQKLLFEQQLKMQANNRANFDLPPDLPIKPGDDIELQFLTETPEGKAVQIQDNLKLVFPDFVTHLATDRPMYRPGETVRFRSLTLERFQPQAGPAKIPPALYRIVGPNNVEIFKKEAASELVVADTNDPAKTNALKGPDGAALFGLGVGEFALPPELAEGEYTLQVSEVNEQLAEEKRSFLVRRWQASPQ